MVLVRWSIVSLGVLAAAPRVAAAQLTGARETRCTLAVKLAGPIATVTEVHELVAPADGLADEARLALALPSGAAVIDARITPPGRRESRAVTISTSALETPTPDAETLGIPPDLGVVRWRGNDGDAERYDVSLAPIDTPRPLRLTITWTVPAAYDDGRLVLRVPARGDAAALAPCEVAVHAGPGGGVRSFGAAFVDGVKVSSTGGRATSAAARALEVELVPAWIGDGPVAASAALTVPGHGDTRALTTVAVYLPPPRGDARFAPRRLLLVIDTSRSLGKDGQAAIAQIADGLIATLAPATPVEVIGFDREARRLLGAWTPARAARTAVARALGAVVPAGGSDLGGALNLATAVVADGDPATVVILTDGVLPTRVDGADLLGHAQMPVSQVTIDAIVPLVPGAPLLGRGAIDALVTAFHGRVVTVRTTELRGRIAKLPRELAAAPPLRDLSVTLDGVPAALAFPEELAPGAGAIARVLSRGRPAKQVHVTGTRTSDAVAFDAVALPAGTAPLALVAAAAGGLALIDVAPLDDDELLGLARAQGTVTSVTGLAVIDTSTPTGAARAELARTAGVFTRTSPVGGNEGVAAIAPTVTSGAPAEVDVNLPGSTYQYLIKYQLWPQLRACYQSALLGKPRFAGTLDLTLELARGEVHDVRIGGSPMPEALIACVATAAYAMEVPQYPLAGLAETIAIVHKPVFLRAPADADGEGEVAEDLGFPVAESPPPPLDGRE